MRFHSLKSMSPEAHHMLRSTEAIANTGAGNMRCQVSHDGLLSASLSHPLLQTLQVLQHTVDCAKLAMARVICRKEIDGAFVCSCHPLNMQARWRYFYSSKPSSAAGSRCRMSAQEVSGLGAALGHSLKKKAPTEEVGIARTHGCPDRVTEPVYGDLFHFQSPDMSGRGKCHNNSWHFGVS